MHSRSSTHHGPLRSRPVLRFRQRPDTEPFGHGRQVAVFWFGVPEGRAFGEFEFRPTAAGFLLFAREPIKERGDEVVVGELVVLLSGTRRADALPLALLLAFGVGGCDESQFAVQNSEQLREVRRTVLVASGLLQCGLRSHAALDVAPEFRQQGLQDSSRGDGMQTVIGIRVAAAESFLQKIHADSLSPPHLDQCAGSPEFGLHHFREQRQPHGNNFSFLSQPGRGHWSSDP